MSYCVRLYCRDCTGTDFQGCFGGGTGWLYADKNIHAPIALFDDMDAAKDAGWNATDDAGPWEFEIVDLDGAVQFDSGAAE